FNIVPQSISVFYRAEGKDYGDAAVGYVEVKREGNFCQVRGKICPEHRVNNKPYSVSMLVNEEIDKVEYVRCEDCAASEEPTATVCYWKKPVLAQIGSNVRAMKAKDLVKNERSAVDLPNNTGFLQGLVQEMKNRNFDCQLSRHFLTVESYKDLSIHSLLISFCNSSQCKDANILAILEENLQTKLQRVGLLLHPDLPIIGASPDALGENFVVEVKCPQFLKSEERYISKENAICSKYMAQIQLQMLMQNVQRGYFCIAKHDFEASQNIIVVCVDFDEQFINKVVADAMTFWKQNIFPVLINGIKR
ncbi:hypothetical protein ALC60_10345, partial [Trachymyrmex zeteki]